MRLMFGLLVYKLCYFTTPFEGGGDLAFLNGQFGIPSRPQYPQNIIDFICIFFI
jgi:AP2-associated kinase